VAYCWAEIPGFSAFGKYTGNGNADGPVIITGFRPRFIIVKKSAGGSNYEWKILDVERNKYNPVNNILYPDGNYSEGVGDANHSYDFLSNGFKVRTSHPATNENGSTYIYAAFAESPSFNLYGAQSNAR
jgi:hypothetical protein